MQAGFLSGMVTPTGTLYYQYGGMTQKLTVEDGTALTWGVFDLDYVGPVDGSSYTEYTYWTSSGIQINLYVDVDFSNLIVGNMKFVRCNAPSNSRGASSVAPAYNGGYNNSNSSQSSGSVYTKCRICGGSGDCTSCGGKGGHYADTGYYTGSSTKSWIDCPSCRGSKRCFNCHGSGRQ